jgi:glycosyltransferase involved in cell wall biosynthesis
MQAQKPKLIYVYVSKASFVQKDIDFLSRSFEVIEAPNYNWTRGTKTPFSMLQQLWWLLRHQRGARLTLVMFGGYWSFFPALVGRLMGRPVMIILGGTDCVAFPPLGYGSLRKWAQRTVIRWSYSLATRLLPVAEALVESDYSYDPASPYPKQGYRHFMPRLRTPYTVIHNGFRPEVFQPDPSRRIPDTVITVASIQNETAFRLKGIDKMIALAEAFPACKFTVVGISTAMQARIGAVPDNLELIAFLPPAEFVPLLQRTEFYLQLSISEGFPNALCEGMLCGCIPIGSNVASIPMIIGDTGFIIARSDLDEVRGRFAEILRTPAAQRLALAEAARARVMAHYTLVQREQAFLDVLAPYF